MSRGATRWTRLASAIVVVGVILSLITMNSSSWLSLFPLLLAPLLLGIYASRGAILNLRVIWTSLALILLLALIFFFLAIPPLYLSWISLFAFLFLASLRKPKTLVLYILFLVIFLPLLLYSRGYLTVTSYNIVKIGEREELKYLFNKPASIVVVGHAMADAIAHAYLSPNEQISEWEEVIVNGTPYWIFAVTPLNTIAQNYVSKILLVHVQTGEVIAKPVHMTVGSGLWLTNNIVLRTYISTSQPIGNTYPFISNGRPYFAACVNKLTNFGLSEIPGDLYVYGEDGSVRIVPQFSGDPSLPEGYDWEYLDWYVGQWLFYLAGENPVSFSFFPRGFLWIPASSYSQDLLNMTLLIPGARGETVRVYFGVSPQNPNSIVSIVIANNTGVYYYNVKSLGIYSPYFVQSLVQSKLPAISGGHLYAKYSQLLYLDGYYWIVPIYAQTDIVTLWGTAVVNATNPQMMKIYQYSSSYGSYYDFLQTVLALRLSEQAAEQPCKLISGTVSQVVEFVYKGDTYVALKINGKLYYATPDIGFEQFAKILTISQGSQAKLCVTDSKIVQVVEP